MARRLKAALSSREELAALAAIDHVPMVRIGAEIGRGETAEPVLLACTQRLAPYVENGWTGEAQHVDGRGWTPISSVVVERKYDITYEGASRSPG